MKLSSVLALAMLLGAAVAACGQNWQEYRPDGDYSFKDVKTMVRRVTDTRMYTGWDDKAFSRYGDLVAVAILETLDDSEMASAEGAKNVLVILHEAFGCPQRCVKVVDERRPRVTLLLLDHLRTITSGKLNPEIDQTTKFIVEQARKDRVDGGE